ncbi:hypothetical protein D3C81_1656650 [compost metagenome]
MKNPTLSLNSCGISGLVVKFGSSQVPVRYMAALSLTNSDLPSSLDNPLKPLLKAFMSTSVCTSAAAWIRPGSSKEPDPSVAFFRVSLPAIRSARYMYHREPVHRSLLPRAIGATPLSESVFTICLNSSYVAGTCRWYLAKMSLL